jgi:hypothetical protein
VDALLRRFPAKPINPDRSVFDLPLELRDGKATALRISLPPHFPQERPSLSVLLPVVHPAVDGTGRLHTPGLGAWVYGSSALVDVVGEAVAALTSAVVDARQPGAAGAGRGAGRAGRGGSSAHIVGLPELPRFLAVKRQCLALTNTHPSFPSPRRRALPGGLPAAARRGGARPLRQPRRRAARGGGRAAARPLAPCAGAAGDADV